VKPKQILGWLAIAFVIWWVIKEPTNAGHVVRNIGTLLTTSANGVSSFFTSL
jgi:hypothetical protein